ncbi:MAG: hypothetical protein FJ090_16625 [Deltaproteobacteria bacterium]|nr:hypothetical protein [Deltaproteobacteria bacterium]
MAAVEGDEGLGTLVSNPLLATLAAAGHRAGLAMRPRPASISPSSTGPTAVGKGCGGGQATMIGPHPASPSPALPHASADQQRLDPPPSLRAPLGHAAQSRHEPGGPLRGISLVTTAS